MQFEVLRLLKKLQLMAVRNDGKQNDLQVRTARFLKKIFHIS